MEINEDIIRSFPSGDNGELPSRKYIILCKLPSASSDTIKT
jgi:hypothetical protein